MGDASDKIAYFQAITGIEDLDLCSDILSANDWDLVQAISSFTSNNNNHRDDDNSSSTVAAAAVPEDSITATTTSNSTAGLMVDGGGGGGPPGLAWKLITLPFSVISGGLGLISGAIGLGVWTAGGVLSYSLSVMGFNNLGRAGGSSASGTPGSEAMDFVASFDKEYGRRARPNFVTEGFMEALQRSKHEFKLLFVYLHSPDHPDAPLFCERTLCNEAVVAFLNENFVSWGGSIRASEGFKMSNSLKASRFPFCAAVMAATNQRIALLQQVEGPKSPEELLSSLHRVLEESAPVLVTARLEAEERQNNMRLREEQDAAYRAALEADQARERQRKEEQERLQREVAEAERRRKEEEEARERAAREAAEKEAALAKQREQKAQSLGAEPEKGPDVTQVLVRFPNGERKNRRFHSMATIKSLYDYVDSLGCLEMESYSLVSNFPRTLYAGEKLSLSLKEAGLHPQASLFVEMNS